ncbi:hypothetical protein Patl1_12686 [Pistacia atlantica]|uniref:Uncharacterized protein n=1 Tax=Pistacia atlantica TaxID=434234 RepID=A0ACC1AVJ1_9ROSI|nr:hypothetical protein Patl1_12686 [Pistacia atlantica]
MLSQIQGIGTGYMDGYSGKRAVDGLVVTKKGSGLVLRDTVNNRDRNAQFCNRIGCSGRLNSMKGAHIGCSEKAKSSRPSFRSSSSGKEIIGSSSRTCAAVSNAKKSPTNPRKKASSQIEADSSETSSVRDEPEVSELVPPPGKIQRGLRPESEDADSGDIMITEEASSSAASNTRSRRNFHHRSGLGNRDISGGSSVSLPFRSTCQTTAANTNRHGLRNLRCNSISDVIPSSSSSSLAESSISKRKDMVKKRSSEGESSSSSRGKKTSESSLEVRNHSSNLGVSISDSRRARNWPPNRDNSVTSVRTRRSANGNNRARLPYQGNGNNLAPNESPVGIQRVPESDIYTDLNVPSSSPQFSLETPSGRLGSYSRPGSSSGSLRGLVPGSPSEVGIPRSLINGDNFGRYNMDGIAEVLSALERIEQDEELSYEQLLVLETNLLLNGLNFYDQHRDMRLDIDDMSYEELLALEERMGSVSTALTEEAISKCLMTSIYQSKALKDATLNCSGNNDDVKCSVCQEDYVAGDEVGRLHCQHRYHVTCIQQWLRLKNWCPICKAAAEPSPPSS